MVFKTDFESDLVSDKFLMVKFPLWRDNKDDILY